MLALFPELLHVAASGNLESLACLVRKYFAARQIYATRLQVEPLLVHAGLQLSRDSLQDAACLRAADHRGAWHVSLVLNPELRDPHEVNFTLAHLFGHFLCDIQPMMASGELKTYELRERSGALRRYLHQTQIDPKERQADDFALALLMPLGMVKQAYATLGESRETASFFNVRPQLMELRLEQLQLKSKANPAIYAKNPDESSETQPPASRVSKGSSPLASTPNLPSSLPGKIRPAAEGSSLVKAQKSQAAQSYRREKESVAPQNPKIQQEPRPNINADTHESGMQRLRAIARKIDRSVDI